MKSFAPVLVILVLLPCSAFAQIAPRAAPSRPSISGAAPSASPRVKYPLAGQVWIGERAPDFELDASSGEAVKLSRTRGDWVLLVFADRRRDLSGLLQAQRSLAERGIRVVGVVHEKQQTLMAQAARDGIEELVLADVTGEISGLYGLFDWERRETRPGFFVLDREGVVKLGVLGQLFPAEETIEMTRFALGAL